MMHKQEKNGVGHLREVTQTITHGGPCRREGRGPCDQKETAKGYKKMGAMDEEPLWSPCVKTHKRWTHRC